MKKSTHSGDGRKSPIATLAILLVLACVGACGEEERVPYTPPVLDDKATLEEAFPPLVCGDFDLQVTGVRYANNIQTRLPSIEVKTGGAVSASFRRDARPDSRFIVVDARARNTASKPRQFFMGEIVIDDKYSYENSEFVEGYDCWSQAIEPLLSEDFTICWEIPKVNSDQIEWRVGDGWCSVDLDEVYAVSQAISGKTAEQATREREEAERSAKAKEVREFKRLVLEEKVKLDVAKDSILDHLSAFDDIGRIHEQVTTSLRALDELKPTAAELDLESTLRDAQQIGDEITKLLTQEFLRIAEDAKRDGSWTISERLDVISHGSGQPAVQGDRNVARLVKDALASCEQEFAAGLEEHQKPDNSVFNQCLQYLIDHDDSTHLAMVVTMLEGHVGRWMEMPGKVDDVELLNAFVSSWKTARMPTLMAQLDEGEIQVAPTVRDSDSMLSRAKLSVVKVVHSGGAGSGVILSASGTMATNHHVVEGHLGGCSVIHPETEEKVRVEVLETYPEWDIAILKPRVGEEFQAWQPMQVNPQTPEGGEEVWALGHPLGLGYKVTRGVASGENSGEELLGSGYDPESIWITTDCSINPGNSGGPLVNEAGQVVGLNTFILGQSHIFIAVAAQHIITAWEAVFPNETSGAGLTSLISAQVSAGSFSVWGKDLLMAYKSRVDAIELQKEREKQEAEMRVKRAAEMAAKAEEDKKAKAWDKFDSFCEVAREGVRDSSFKTADDALEGAVLELAAIREAELEGVDRGETITQFLRVELKRKEKGGEEIGTTELESLIQQHKRIADGEDCRDQEGILLNAYAAFRIVQFRVTFAKFYARKQARATTRSLKNKYGNFIKEQEVKASPYLSLLKTRFSSERDENGRNLLSRANGL